MSGRRLNLCRKTGKRAHPYYADAARHAKQLARRYHESFGDYDVYPCHHCGLWHVGHRKDTTDERPAAQA